MRLIDAEPIQAELLKKADVFDSKNPYKQIKIDLYRRFFEMIFHAPTVSAVRVAYSQLKNEQARRLFEKMLKGSKLEVVEVTRCINCQKFGTKDCFKRDDFHYSDTMFCSEGEPRGVRDE